MIPVILSGGSGTRLWPVSRTKLPKQFCDLFEGSLLSLTLKRLMPFAAPWMVTAQTLRDLTIREAKANDIPLSHLLFEPMARNTAPAIAWLCFELQKKNALNEVVGIFPADHLIENETAFRNAILQASLEADHGKIVTLGIRPSFPSTGYGYIQVGNMSPSELDGTKSFAVSQFHEKPSYEKASQFLAAKNFFWNAGIFVFKVDTMIKAFQKHQPELWNKLSTLKSDHSNLKEVFGQLENISVDYAIMEKLDSTQLACIPCDIGWSDVGSWDAIQELVPNSKDIVSTSSAKDNFVFSKEDKHYAFIDTNELIVVDTKDALLIAKKGTTQNVKEVYDQVKTKWPKLALEHVFEFRPWGRYEILKDTERFKSKVIEVLPHEQLSYQSHTQREEHWIITAGAGEVVLDDKIVPVRAGSYVKIPLGAKHRMRNTADQKLEFIEVQLGTYFGEDDIIRYQDDYQRA